MNTRWNRSASLLLALVLLITLFAGCASDSGSQSPANPSPSESQPAPEPSQEALLEEPEDIPLESADPVDVRVGALKGPTGMALARLRQLAEESQTANRYQVSFEGAPDVIQGQLMGGQLDLAAVPTNLAAVLYNKTEGEIQIIALSDMKVLYLMAAPGVEINSFEDLKGKTLFTAGQGSTQEYVLDYLLRQKGIDPAADLTVEFKSEHAETVAQLLAGNCDVALLPQPFVTTVQTQNAEVKIAVDINEVWNEVSGGAPLAMSCIVARKGFLEENPQVYQDFVQQYADSIAYANNNVEEAAALIAGYEIIPEAVAKQALPVAAIRAVAGAEMKAPVEDYLSILFEQNPQSVGGALPDENFYYIP